MPLTAGTRFGPYEIAALLGQGGMGEVYRARDTTLHRDVAIKVLPAAVDQDADRLARFTREAQALAALNHPHIAQVYGLQPVDGTSGGHAIVMELVDGPTLADRLAQGPLSVSETLACARQIAEALDAAHERGIVHRDLKPANIKLTSGGIAKVLDFGLAKPGATAAASATGSGADPTMLSPAVTQHGVVLGTAAYMSPEQARGQAVDKRADIWAFGVVLYEMLTGRTLFAGDTVSDTIAEVLKRDIDLAALPVGTPLAVRRVIARCLERDPRQRLRDIADAAYDLSTPDSSFTPPEKAPVRRMSGSLLALAALLAAAIAAGITWWLTRPAPAPAAVVARALYDLPGGPVRRTIQRPHIAISPDGRYLAAIRGNVATSSAAMVRRLDQLEWTMVAGSENAAGVFFSPDSQWVGFWTNREIKRVALGGGSPQTVYTLPSVQLNGPNGVSWADTGIIYVIEDDRRIVAISAAGGAPAAIVKTIREARFGIEEVHALPGGRGLLYARLTDNTATTIVLHRFGSEPDVDLVEGGSPRFLASGQLLFSRGNALYAAPVDLEAARLTAQPVMVAEGIAWLNPVTQYSVSDTGTLVYIPRDMASEPPSTLYRVNRIGVATEMPSATREYSDPRLSPDGRRLAVHLTDQDDDVWVTDFSRGALTRLSFTPAEDETPAWSPDGEWLAYSGWCGSGEGARCIYKRRADGSGESEILARMSTHAHVNDWSPDGTTLVVESVHAERRGDLFVLDARGGELRPYLTTEFAEQSGRVSPDGKWLAYQSTESGEAQVYVQSFPTPGSKIQVSTDGGLQPVWARDGRELYFRSAMQLMAARVSAAGTLVVDRPVALFTDAYLRPQGDSHTGYDVFPDGSFLFIDLPRTAKSNTTSPSFVAVFNWFEELAALARR